MPAPFGGTRQKPDPVEVPDYGDPGAMWSPTAGPSPQDRFLPPENVAPPFLTPPPQDLGEGIQGAIDPAAAGLAGQIGRDVQAQAAAQSELLYGVQWQELANQQALTRNQYQQRAPLNTTNWQARRDNLTATVKQSITLAMFCRKVGIPFDLYAFSDRTMSRNEWDDQGNLIPNENYAWNNVEEQYKYNDLRMLNFLSSSMNQRELRPRAAYSSRWHPTREVVTRVRIPSLRSILRSLSVVLLLRRL